MPALMQRGVLAAGLTKQFFEGQDLTKQRWGKPLPERQSDVLALALQILSGVDCVIDETRHTSTTNYSGSECVVIMPRMPLFSCSPRLALPLASTDIILDCLRRSATISLRSSPSRRRQHLPSATATASIFSPHNDPAPLVAR